SFSKNVGLRLYLPNNFAIHRIGISGFAQYTLGWAEDNQSAQNQYDWNSEWAHSSFDTRHRFTTNITIRTPKDSSFSFLVFANSGRPYSLTTGLDNNGDQSTNDRPDGVKRNSLIGPGSYNVNMSFTKTFNLKKTERTESAKGGGSNGGPIGMPGGPVM